MIDISKWLEELDEVENMSSDVAGLYWRDP